VHWISCVPVSLPDTMFSVLTKQQHLRAQFAEQARRDWHRFLCLRGAEMRSGALLLVAMSYAHADRPPQLAQLCSRLDSAVAHLRDEGVLSEKEVLAMTNPVYHRSVAEVLSGISEASAESGLRLVSEPVFYSPLCRHRAELLDTAEPATQEKLQMFAQRVCGFILAIEEPFIRTALGGRSASDADAVMERIRARLESEIIADSNGVRTGTDSMLFVLQK